MKSPFGPRPSSGLAVPRGGLVLGRCEEKAVDFAELRRRFEANPGALSREERKSLYEENLRLGGVTPERAKLAFEAHEARLREVS